MTKQTKVQENQDSVNREPVRRKKTRRGNRRGGREKRKARETREKKRKNFKIGFWNIAGMLNKDKKFWDYIKGFDVVGLTETWVEERSNGRKWKIECPKNSIGNASLQRERRAKGERAEESYQE